MARIVYTGIVSHINGTVAGTTFQRNAYGQTIKKKPSTVNPNRIMQQTRKSSLQLISQTWQTVSLANRTAWANQAVAHPVPSRLNPSANLSGHALWLRINLLSALIGGGIIQGVANPNQNTLTLGTSEVQRVGSTLIFFDDSDSSLNNMYVLCFMSGYVKPTQLYDRSRTRFMGFFPLLTFDQVDITAEYTAQFGVLPSTGQHVFLRRLYICLQSGQVIEYPQQNVQIV